MSNTISNLDDTIGSLDVIARIEELSSELGSIEDCFDETKNNEAYNQAVHEWHTSDNGTELKNLQALAEQGENSASDWQYGVQLIHEDYFETAMDEMIADCYTLPEDLPFWMTITYDYDALKQDYTAIDFDGQIYYVR